MAAVDLLHITDTHLTQDGQERLLGVDTAASLWAVMGQALAQRTPDAILVSGDIAHDAKTETYMELDARLRGAFDGDIRYACGNHDSMVTMREAGLDQSNLRLGEFTLVITDTHAEGEVEGEFTEPDLATLKAQLAASNTRHILVCGHHAPVEIGTPWLDEHRIRGSELLLDCLRADRRVRGYVFGHVHQAFDTNQDSLRLLATPSTCFQFLPGSATFSLDTRSAGYRRIRLHSDGEIESDVHRVPGVPHDLDRSSLT